MVEHWPRMWEALGVSPSTTEKEGLYLHFNLLLSGHLCSAKGSFNYRGPGSVIDG